MQIEKQYHLVQEVCPRWYFQTKYISNVAASALLELTCFPKMCQIPHRTVCLTQLTAVALNAVRKIARHSHSALQNGRQNSAQGRCHRRDTWAAMGAANERRWLDRRLSASYIRSCCKKYPSQPSNFPNFGRMQNLKWINLDCCSLNCILTPNYQLSKS